MSLPVSHADMRMRALVQSFGGNVRVVNGAYRGEEATLLGINAADYNVRTLSSVPVPGRLPPPPPPGRNEDAFGGLTVAFMHGVLSMDGRVMLGGEGRAGYHSHRAWSVQ